MSTNPYCMRIRIDTTSTTSMRMTFLGMETSRIRTNIDIRPFVILIHTILIFIISMNIGAKTINRLFDAASNFS